MIRFIEIIKRLFRFNFASTIETYRNMAAVVFIRVSAINDEAAADAVVILAGNYVNNLQT